MSNHGCYIGSLGSLCRWLGEQAEALGVEIYPGISVIDAMFGPNGEVEGVITGDMGVARDGTHKDSHASRVRLGAASSTNTTRSRRGWQRCCA